MRRTLSIHTCLQSFFLTFGSSQTPLKVLLNAFFENPEYIIFDIEYFIY